MKPLARAVQRWQLPVAAMVLAMTLPLSAMAQQTPPPTESDAAELETPALEDLLVSILILDVSLVDIPPGIEKVLIGPISAEVAQDHSLAVLTGEDVRRLSELETNRAFAGCDQTSCASEIADALGAELVIFSTLGRLGDAYLFNMNLIDTSSATNLGRVSASADEVGDLREVVVLATRDLMSRYRKKTRRPKAQALTDAVTDQLREAAPSNEPAGDSPPGDSPPASSNPSPAPESNFVVPAWASTAWVVSGVALAGGVFLSGAAFDFFSPTSVNNALDFGDFVGPTLMVSAVGLGAIFFVFNPFQNPAKPERSIQSVAPKPFPAFAAAAPNLSPIGDESEGQF